MTTVRQLLEGKGEEYWSIDPDASVYDAIVLMAERQIGALLVMRGESLDGIVSERDYARKVILKGRSSRDTAVREIMTSDVVRVSPDDTVQHCMSLMTDGRLRHLPVVENGKVIGVVSIGDLVKSIIAEQQFTIEQLSSYISG
jgi:CBS domain-containing protein